ncbi:MAG: hypothetical protein IT577_12915 [Verrucomicrobiae bacterium]|nr:hypothetical protein [Verrucomicrobiae bacterium]
MRNWIIGVVVFVGLLLANPSDREHLKALDMSVEVDSGEARGSERGLEYYNFYICSAMAKRDRETRRSSLLSIGAVKIVIPLVSKQAESEK